MVFTTINDLLIKLKNKKIKGGRHMSEMRKNNLTQEWIIYAENRQKRPYEFEKKMTKKQKRDTPCPFCQGNEDQTTQAIFQDNPQNWTVRVFPNRFPAVQQHCDEVKKEEFYDGMAALGQHEVLVDTPHHDQTIEQFTQEHIQKVLSVLQSRFIEIQKNENTKQVQIFKNAGADAGMSIQHSHWQLVGLPTVSKRQQTYQQQSKEYYQKNHKCIICDMIAWEKDNKTRICGETERFIAIAPYASRFSYEVWIIPKKHISSFAQIDQNDIEDLAGILKKMLVRVKELREDISYNICFMEGGKEEIHTDGESLHWAIQIFPRIGGFAGLEFSTETYINSVLPETAAKWYRSE